MTDLPQLRAWYADHVRELPRKVVADVAALLAEIARLTATVDRYAEALRPFAEIGTSPDRTFDYYTPAALFMPTIPHSWVAAARVALASQPAPPAHDSGHAPGVMTLAEAVVDVFGDHRSRVGAVLHQERIDEVLAVANAVLSRPSQPAPVAPDTAHAPGIMPATEPLLVPNRVSLPPSEWKCSCTREERDSKCYRHPSCAECGEATTHPVEACVEHWTRNGARLQPAPVAPETRERVTVREACRRRMPLDGADAQCLEHALTITERDRMRDALMSVAAEELKAGKWAMGCACSDRLPYIYSVVRKALAALEAK